jgi:hypothetical protein
MRSSKPAQIGSPGSARGVQPATAAGARQRVALGHVTALCLANPEQPDHEETVRGLVADRDPINGEFFVSLRFDLDLWMLFMPGSSLLQCISNPTK